MVAVNRISPFNDYPTSALPEDVLVEVVYMRARAHSWEETARAVESSAEELRRATRHDPNFAAALEIARKEVEQEAEAETLQRLRAQLNDPKSSIAIRAAQTIARYLGDKHREETRLEVERIRAESAARPKAAPDQETNDEPAEEDALTPEQIEHVRVTRERHNRRHAEECAREKAIIYLWGGCHKLGSTPPDRTDTPLEIFGDDTVPGGKVFWAVTQPPPLEDPLNGPFLAPPGCRPPTCPPQE